MGKRRRSGGGEVYWGQVGDNFSPYGPIPQLMRVLQLFWNAVMIITFADNETERIWNGLRSRKLPADIQQRALAKLAVLNRVKSLDELKNPPSNRLHALTGGRAGQHSLSINKQWRICFVWKDGNAHDVEIVDYH
jgi:toxin HigB-1